MFPPKPSAGGAMMSGMATQPKKLNPSASMFDNPTDEAGEPNAMADLESRVKNLETRVAALEAAQQSDSQEDTNSGFPADLNA